MLFWLIFYFQLHFAIFSIRLTQGDSQSSELIIFEAPEVQISAPFAFSRSGKIYFSSDDNNLELNCVLSRQDLKEQQVNDDDPSQKSNNPFLIPNQQYSIMWTKNAILIEKALSNEQYEILDNRLLLKRTSKKDTFEGDYACNVTWPNIGSILSSAVSVRQSDNVVNQNLNNNVDHINATVNSTAFIPCFLPDIRPEVAIVWFVKDNTTEFKGTDADKKFVVTKRGLHLMVTTENDNGLYTCFAKNLVSHQIVHSRAIKLSVSANSSNETFAPVTVIVPNQKQTEILVNIGENVTLECAMSGSPMSPRLVWEKYGGLLNPSKHSQILGSLILINVSKDDEGSYICRADPDKDGDVNYQPFPYIVYTVTVDEPVKARFSIKSSLSYEDAWQLTCDSVGGRATDMILYINGQVLLNGVTRPIHAKIDGGDRPKWTLVFDKNSLLNGIYQCIVRNPRSSIPSDSHSLYVSKSATIVPSVLNDKSEDDQLLPKIIQGPENATSFEYSPVTFVCRVALEDNVFWLKDNVPIKLGGRLRLIGTGTLEISRVTMNDKGWYSCVASNSEGNATSGAFLSVERSPLKTFSDKIPLGQVETSTGVSPIVFLRNRNDGYLTDWSYDVTPPIILPARKKLLNFEFEVPSVYRLTNSSILLTWKLSRTDYEAQFFRIQYKNASVQGTKWATLEPPVKPHLRAHVIENVVPGYKYKFRIGAMFENSQTVSKITPKFLLANEPEIALPSFTPENIEIKATAPSALKMSWIYPANDSSTVEGFVVMYRRLYSSNAANGPIIYHNDVVIGGSVLEHVIMHLLPATPYEVKIFAFNSGGRGQLSRARVQTTLTADGMFSPLSFLPALTSSDSKTTEKNLRPGKPPVSSVFKHQPIIFGLSQETFLLISGSLIIFVLILAIIGTIAWSITGKRKAKYRAVATSKRKFRDTSKRIFYESSLPRELSSKVVANFYSYSLPSYESALEKEKDLPIILPVPQVYSSDVDCTTLNLYSNLLHDGEDLSSFDQCFAEELEESPKSITRSITEGYKNCLDVSMDRRSGSVASYRSDRSKSVGTNATAAAVPRKSSKSMAGSFHSGVSCGLPDLHDKLSAPMAQFGASAVPFGAQTAFLGDPQAPKNGPFVPLNNSPYLCWTPRGSSPATVPGSVDRRSWNFYHSSPTSPPNSSSEFDEVKQFYTFKPDRSPQNKAATGANNRWARANNTSAPGNNISARANIYSAQENNISPRQNVDLLFVPNNNFHNFKNHNNNNTINNFYRRIDGYNSDA